MRFAVVGAGSIGGYVGALLSAAGDDVTFIARGANLDAIRDRGMKVVTEDGHEVVAKNVRAFNTMREAGPHDTVLLTVKAHQVAAVAGDLHHLCDATTSIVTMQNGIPWWYFQRHGGRFERTPILATDPDGSIARAVDAARIIGTVVYPAAVLESPGVVKVVEGRRFTFGELDGSTTPRIEAIAARFVAAGFKAPVSDDLRAEIWLKLIGNLAFNPISALTRATLQDLLPVSAHAPAVRADDDRGRDDRDEAGHHDARRHRAAHRRRGKRRRAQDLDAAGRRTRAAARDRGARGRSGELGKLTDSPTPHIDAVYACTKLLERTAEGGRQKAEAGSEMVDIGH